MQPATEWGWQEVLLNKISYLLEVIVWQNATPSKKGEKAKHMAQKPVMFMPSFMPKQPGSTDQNKDLVAADVDTIKELLARPRK